MASLKNGCVVVYWDNEMLPPTTFTQVLKVDEPVEAVLYPHLRLVVDQGKTFPHKTVSIPITSILYYEISQED